MEDNDQSILIQAFEYESEVVTQLLFLVQHFRVSDVSGYCRRSDLLGICPLSVAAGSSVQPGQSPLRSCHKEAEDVLFSLSHLIRYVGIMVLVSTLETMAGSTFFHILFPTAAI